MSLLRTEYELNILHVVLESAPDSWQGLFNRLTRKTEAEIV